MNAFFELIWQHPLMELIGWTLVHSLWQGLLIGLGLAGALHFWQTNVATQRYNIACAALFATVACVVATLVWLIADSDAQRWQMAAATTPPQGAADWEVSGNSAAEGIQQQNSIPSTLSRDAMGASSTHDSNNAEAPGLLNRDSAARPFAEWMPWLSAVWLTGIVILSMRMAGGLWTIRRWKRRGRELSEPQLDMIVSRLSRKMDLNWTIRCLESLDVGVPTVIGFWRPVLLVPLGIFSGLTVNELESILAHELAHVRRRDWLVNLLQTVAETLLFYHPAVWWISRIIRTEREHCCDDAAIAVCGDRLTLAKALTILAESRAEVLHLSLSASGGSLACRIRRILLKQEANPAAKWPTLLMALATILLFVGAMWTSSIAAIPGESSRQDLAASTNRADLQEEASLASLQDWPRHQREEIHVDAVTGESHSVLPSVRLSGPTGQQATLAMKYSNLLNYTFVPAKVAQEIGAIDLGEIDFGPSPPQQSDGVQVELDPSNRESGSQQLVAIAPAQETVAVNELHEPAGNRKIVPYSADAVWIPEHLAFYGLNRTKQKKFRVVRIANVNLSLGPEFGPVNALVLDDANSALGVLGVDWTRLPRGPQGEGFVWEATGDFRFLKLDTERAKTSSGLKWVQPQEEVMLVNEPSDAAMRRLQPSDNEEKLATPTQDKTEWGALAEFSGRQSRLICQTQNPTVGKPLLFTLELRNAGEKPLVFDPQDYAPHRVLRAEHTEEKPTHFIGMTPQTSSQPITLQPGERTVLWQDVDAAELFLLSDGQYKFYAEGGEWAMQTTWRDSNSVKVEMVPGQETPRQALIRSLIELESRPEDWKVTTGFGAIYLTHSPTNLKRDVTTIQLWFTKEPLPADYRLGDGPDQQLVTTLGRYDIGYLHLGSPAKASELWPEHSRDIRTAARTLDSEAKPNVPDGNSEQNRGKELDPNVSKPWLATGLITDSQGKPMPGVTVRAHCGLGSLRLSGSTTSDSDGRYELRFGPVWSSANPKFIQAATISVAAPEFVERNLHRQGDLIAALELPDDKDLALFNLQPSEVFLPQQAKTIDFVMVPATKLAGVVIDRNGDRLDGMSVSLTGPDLPPSTSVVAQTRTDKGGRFELTDLPTGFTYQLVIESAKESSTVGYWKSVPLTLEKYESGTVHFTTQSNGQRTEWTILDLLIQVEESGTNKRSDLQTTPTTEVNMHVPGINLQGLTHVRAPQATMILTYP
ncbi:MAG: M48 family metalloprotease [Planctomycetaceae bacterium]|nr:M48 family metalloprotease [Planctomycetaceae bacterium]